MTRVTLRCASCGMAARRSLFEEPGSRGVHEALTEPAFCPRGHGPMARIDGHQSLRQEQRDRVLAGIGTSEGSR
jgi:hypothetical protein